MFSMNKKALAIDGNSLFYRMYYATQNQVEYALQNHWTPNNGIKLMLSTINKIVSSDQYDYVFIAFDAGSKTFRHTMIEGYKDGRTKTPDELIKQMHDTMLMLSALGYYVVSKEGIEADDLIGSFSHLMSQNEIACHIYTSDKDLLQLVNEYTTVRLLKTGLSKIEEYNIQNFQEKFFNLTPSQIIEYKTIIGDKSDNIPGINGVGEKTGISLINKYGSLQNIYEHLNELSPALQEKFINQKNLAETYRQIVTILINQYDGMQVDEFIKKNKDFTTITRIVKEYNLSKLTFLLEDKLF